MFNFSEVRENNAMVPSPDKLSRPCLFLGVKRDEQSKALIFDFQENNPTKAVLSHREFVPTRQDNTSDEDYKKAINGTVSRLAHIFRAFVTEEEYNSIKVDDSNNLNKAVENWMSVTGQMGKILKTKLAGGPLECDLKVVYTVSKGKYYAGLPYVPPFISTKNHPKVFTANPQYDKFVIPAVTPTNMPNQTAPGGSPAPAGTATAPSGDEDF